MKKRKLQSGEVVYVLEGNEPPMRGEINFWSEKELELALKLASSIHDPEEKAAFKKTLIEKKKADDRYSLFADFPEIGSELPAESDPTQVSPSADVSGKRTPIGGDKRRGDFAGSAICRATIDMLRGRQKEEA